MEFDFSAIAILSLFRGVLGLALGVALGNALRDLRARKFVAGVLGLGHAAVYVALVASMHVSIEAYNEYPLIYWGVFAFTVMAGTIKTESVLKTIALGLYAIFGGSFLLFGVALAASALRTGFSIPGLGVGIIFVLIGGAVLGVMIYPYLKGKSLTDD